MTSRYEVTLGDVKMSTLDKDLLILDVGYPVPEYETDEYTIANLDGYDISDTRLKKQLVTVTFELHIYDTQKRNEACQKVNAWAQAGGTLKINDRKDQYLSVRCEQYASVESVRDWTAPLTLTFATVAIPYWQSTTQKVLTVSGASASGTLKMDGNTKEALVSVEVTANVAITAFEVTVGSTKIVLKDISVAKNKELIIDYKNSRFLRIRADGTSILKKLQPESTDNLRAKCGTNVAVTMKASGKVTAVFKARGLWL